MEKRYKHTKEECISVFLKYKTIGDLLKSTDKNYYFYAYLHGWIEEIRALRPRVAGSRYKRAIYAYEFLIKQRKYVYVGLTYNIHIRHEKHCNTNSSPVYKFCKEKNIKPIKKPKQLTDYVDAQEASMLEQYYCDLYKNNGWILLNKNKAGALGNMSYKTKKIVCVFNGRKEEYENIEGLSKFIRKNTSTLLLTDRKLKNDIKKVINGIKIQYLNSFQIFSA